MKVIIIPGYSDLFGSKIKSYEDILSNVSSDIAIKLIVSLNNELNVNESILEQQARLRKIVSSRYTKEQLAFLDNGVREFKLKMPHYDGMVFGRRYLLNMLLKELKRNHKCDTDVNDPVHEFNFLLAYLMIIDEVKEEDGRILERIKMAEKDEMSQLNMVWAGFVNQYEFNHNVNSVFELFRLLCFSKYSHNNLRIYTKELINRNGFKSLSEFLSSYNQLLNSTLNIQNDKPLKKLYFINPKDDVDRTHLKSQSINSLIGNEELSISDIRKYPLYETDENQFMVIDEDFYRKKIYRGPLFEIYYNTGLKNVMTFPDYKTRVSKEVLEKICFKEILNSLRKSKHDVIYFDDDADSQPDLYFRRGNKIILIEFKDYLFPDSVVEGTRVDSVKKYIDERFLVSDKGQNKGVNQLINHVRNLYNGKFEFDHGLSALLAKNKKIEVTPIICYSDFFFSMPGINEYLSSEFKKNFNGCNYNNSLENVTLINLEVLFDFSMKEGDFGLLNSLIKRYWKIIGDRRAKSFKNGGMDSFLLARVSFDEIYEIIFKKELKQKASSMQNRRLNEILNSVEISQGFLDEIL